MRTYTTAYPQIAREGLGLSVDELAARLQIDPQRVRQWEAGGPGPTLHQHQQLDQLLTAAADEVWEHVSRLTPDPEDAVDLPIPAVMILDDVDETGAEHGWQRAIAFRVLQAVPHLEILHHTDQE